MLTIGALILSYAYTTTMGTLFFSSVLKQRYSRRITALGTALCWMVQCLLKMPFFFSIGMQQIAWVNMIAMINMFVYQICLFRATPVRRILSMALFYVYEFSGDLIATRIACIVFGGNKMMQTDSGFTLMGICITCLWATTALYPVICLWRLLMRVGKGQRERRLWLCVLLPLSQCILMEYFVDRYASKYRNIPAWSFAGMMLGLFVDFYMFFLFYREEQRYLAEQELLRERELYNKEQVYYENLRESQEETARLRHDYQNYMQVLENMAQKGDGCGRG